VVSFFIIPVLVWLTISENTISYYLVGILLAWDYALTTYIFKRVLVLNIPASAVISLIYAGFTYFGAYTLGQLVQ
jgi:ABC-type cobalamin transport system permease subunit